MIVVCTDADRKELMEVLLAEGVTHQVGQPASTRELGTGSYELFTIQANLPEVKVPPEHTQGEAFNLRAWRLPSGRLIITDLEGNLEQIVAPRPE
jgi:hypothetical protein